MTCPPNAFRSGEALIRLEPGESFSGRWGISPGQGAQRMNSGRPHRVVIVGAGFGGLFAAKFLRRAPVEVLLLDRTNHHLFQPLLYQVATGILSAGEVAPATRDILHRHKNVTVELGEVDGFDLAARTLTARRPDGRPSRSATTAWWWRPASGSRTSDTTSSRNGRRG